MLIIALHRESTHSAPTHPGQSHSTQNLRQGSQGYAVVWQDPQTNHVPLGEECFHINCQLFIFFFSVLLSLSLFPLLPLLLTLPTSLFLFIHSFHNTFHRGKLDPSCFSKSSMNQSHFLRNHLMVSSLEKVIEIFWENRRPQISSSPWL